MIVTVLFALTGLLAFCATSWRARTTRGDAARMAGYIASLKAVAADHRSHIAVLEQSLAGRDQILAAQERLLEGQAAHLCTFDPHYAG